MDIASLIQDFENAQELSGVLRSSTLLNKLTEFNSQHKTKFEFGSASIKQFKKLAKILFVTIRAAGNVNTNNSQFIIKVCLECLKILSRSKDFSNALSDVEEYTLDILSLAGAVQEKITELSASHLNSDTTETRIEDEIKLEALKTVCNGLFHSSVIRQVFMKQRSSECITRSLDIATINNSFDEEIQFVQVKILFLISALEQEERIYMRMDYKTTELLIKLLEETLQRNGLLVASTDSSEGPLKEKDSCIFSEYDTKLMSEILKTLFNVSVNLCDEGLSKESDVDLYEKLSMILYCLLGRCAPLPEKPEMLLRHVAHMLVNIPKSCLNPLIPSVKRRQWQDVVPKKEGYPIEYELKDMSAIITLVVELERELNSSAKDEQGNIKVFSILTVLCHVCRCLCLVRKYLRIQILPPLKQATVRPEESDGFKGRLVKLMTDVDTNVKSMAADFLFVLCKENPDRLVKHTGYGNAAGLFASRGLMSGSKHIKTGDYSSDDDDSETEEYQAVADHVDVMTGAVSKGSAIEDPMSGMTDEEKERNAEELMGLIGRLTSLNVVKPMRIGPDGRPQEIDEDEAKRLIREKIDKAL